MKTSFSVSTSKGDILRVGMSTADESFLSPEICSLLSDLNIEIIEVSLERMEGNAIIGISTLLKVSETIANFLLENENGILFYYCDDLLDIPMSNHQILPQEYRNALFSDLFDLYQKHHNIKGLHDMSIKINAIDRPLFMHFIARDSHMHILEKIAYDMKISYSK